MNASDIVREELNSVSELMRLTKLSRYNLIKMQDLQPELFEILVLGAFAKKNRVEISTREQSALSTALTTVEKLTAKNDEIAADLRETKKQLLQLRASLTHD